jgi:hypothetical protein
MKILKQMGWKRIGDAALAGLVISTVWTINGCSLFGGTGGPTPAQIAQAEQNVATIVNALEAASVLCQSVAPQVGGNANVVNDCKTAQALLATVNALLKQGTTVAPPAVAAQAQAALAAPGIAVVIQAAKAPAAAAVKP